MNVFSLDLNVAIELDCFNEAGSLFRGQGIMNKNALSEKHRSDVLGTLSRKGSSEVLKPMPPLTF